MNYDASTRFQAIDALRGIAALLVVWHHTSETFIKKTGVAAHGTFLADIARDIDFGRIGIICFFLISGFVIPSSLNQQKSHGIKHFAIRRFFRLYPAYWLSIVIIVIIATLYNTPSSTSTVLANTTMLQGFFAKPHLNGLYWTLQVELVFYCFCAFLYYFKVLENIKIIFAIIAVSFVVFVVIQCIPVLSGKTIALHKEFQLLPYLLSVMFLGYFYRKLYDDKHNNLPLNKPLYHFTIIATLMCLGLPIFLLMSNLIGYELVDHSFRFGTGHSLGFLLFFSGVLFLKNIPKLILWFGTISYSLYLFHPIVMRLISQMTNQYNILQGYHISFYILISAIISIFIAYIIYMYIEKPAIKIGQRLSHEK